MLIQLMLIVAILVVFYFLIRAPWKLHRVQHRPREWSSGLVLVAVGAQHPLRNGSEVNEIYKLRLDAAIEIYTKISTTSSTPTKILLCGSQHRGDQIPLWQAGKDYLLQQGIPESGVVVYDLPCYNCMDECLAFLRLYSEGALITHGTPRLILIDARHKVLRKMIVFAWLAGWLPQFSCTQENPDIRQRLGEFALTVYTLLLDPDWQGSFSLMCWWTWTTRQTSS